MNVKAVIDRFEENKAVLLVGEDERQVVWPKKMLPDEVAEGDILQVHFEVDTVATIAAKREAALLLKAVLDKNQDE